MYTQVHCFKVTPLHSVLVKANAHNETGNKPNYTIPPVLTGFYNKAPALHHTPSPHIVALVITLTTSSTTTHPLTSSHHTFWHLAPPNTTTTTTITHHHLDTAISAVIDARDNRMHVKQATYACN